MWKPGDVIDRDRARGICVWFILIAGIITYTALLIKAAVDSRQNPTTSFVTTNDAYNYPDVMVCMYKGYGCDRLEDEGDCAGSFNKTQGVTQAKFNPGMDNEQDVSLLPGWTEEKGHCVNFYTSQVATPGGEPDPEDYFILDVSWFPGGHDNNSTTCIQQEGGWTSHSESVSVFFRDPETGILSAGMQLPYTCMTNQSNGYIFNYVGIGLTRKVKLDPSDNSESYRALITYAYFKKDKRDDIADIIKPYARFSLEVGREVNSLEVITEVDPFEIEGIFGEIGGAWDMLLMLWPIFFVYAVPREAQYKARHFSKSARRASGLVRNIKTSVSFKPKEQTLPRRAPPVSPSASGRTVDLDSITAQKSMSSTVMGISSRQDARPTMNSPSSKEGRQLPPPQPHVHWPASVVATV